MFETLVRFASILVVLSGLVFVAAVIYAAVKRSKK
jgi:hypothetical protein